MPPMRAFGYFSHEGKVTRVRAGKAREPSNRIAAIRGKETCFSPARPATGASKPIGTLRWHRRSENGARRRSPRTNS